MAGDNGLTEGPGGLVGSTADDIALIAADGSGATVLRGSERAEGLAYHAPNGLLYATAHSGMKSLNPATGLLVSPLTGPGADLESLASDGVGTIFGIGESPSLHAYDVATDTWSIVGPTGLANEFNDVGLAYDPFPARGIHERGESGGSGRVLAPITSSRILGDAPFRIGARFANTSG